MRSSDGFGIRKTARGDRPEWTTLSRPQRLLAVGVFCLAMGLPVLLCTSLNSLLIWLVISSFASAGLGILLIEGVRLERINRARKADWKLCLRCGYDVRSIQSERCPECGAAVDKEVLARVWNAADRSDLQEEGVDLKSFLMDIAFEIGFAALLIGLILLWYVL